VSSKIKIGDLVCYNAGGQKKRTLGLVLDMMDEKSYGEAKTSALILWCCVGNGLLPRRGYSSPNNYDYSRREVIGTGSIVWHQVGDWFEVVK
tara:strand:+ start:56 stop:331 length:276 start_codon:yes stop_codon:yes gene_type:complete